MNIITAIFSFIIHIDQHLIEIIEVFGIWSYVILFLIIFIETGLVIFPFLPGDSLLFASGTFAALKSFNLISLLILFFIAAVLGDSLNYYLGSKFGQTKFITKRIDQNKMEKAEMFFNKHGGKTIVIARFMPFIRTFIPFIAGTSKMNYKQFLTYNIIGGFLWVFICTIAGYLFGNTPIIKNNFSVIILIIIFISVLPALLTFIKQKIK